MSTMDSELGKQSHGDIEAVEQLYATGATCDTYLVRIYGKLHFLKRLKAEFASQPRYVLAFRKEFETGFALDHPALPRYVALHDEHQRPAIIEEYVEGATLTEFLHQHPDYFHHRAHARKFVDQLLSVLGYLHQHQVLFLDLKPDNILITDIDHDVRLVDLGFCYTPGFNDTPGLTPDFAAPEQLQSATVDERTDIYLLGKVLQFAGIPAIYNKVVRKCLAANPINRYATIEEIAKAISKAEKQPKRIAAIIISIVALLAVALLFVLSPSKRQVSTPATSTSAPTNVVQNSKQPTVSATQQSSASTKQSSTSSSPSSPVGRTTAAPEQGSKEESSANTETDQMNSDIHREMDKIYATTLKQFKNDETVPGLPFYAAFEEYRDRTDVLKQQMAKAHPAIPFATISEQVDRYTSKLVYPVAVKVKAGN